MTKTISKLSHDVLSFSEAPDSWFSVHSNEQNKVQASCVLKLVGCTKSWYCGKLDKPKWSWLLLCKCSVFDFQLKDHHLSQGVILFYGIVSPKRVQEGGGEQ